MDAMFSHSLFLIIILSLFAGRGVADKAQALFVFGASYVDTGNRNPYNESVNQSWRRPYGLTWPGYPVFFWKNPDRFLGGYFRGGVNFAVDGSGISQSLGFTTVPQQVEQFKEVIRESLVFDFKKLSRSIVPITVIGNDYITYISSRNSSTEGLIDLVEAVVNGIIDAVKYLYEGGLRSFAVSNIARFGCDPQIGKTSCNSNFDDFLALHTRLLTQGVERLRSNQRDLSIIITDLVSATNYVFSNPARFGFVDLFVPCCARKGGIDLCAEVDQIGRHLYEVCSNVDKKFFWDFVHPTQQGWYSIMWLYSNGVLLGENKIMSFIVGAPNVKEWLNSLGFVAYNISSQ